MIEPVADGKSVCLIDGKPLLPGRALETLKALAIAKKLPFPFDPFIEGSLSLQIECDGEGAIISAHVKLGKNLVPLETTKVFSPYLICDKGMLHLIDVAIPTEWFFKLAEGPLMLMGDEYETFYASCDDGSFPKLERRGVEVCDVYGAQLRSDDDLTVFGYQKRGSDFVCPVPEASDKLKALIEQGFAVTRQGVPVVVQSDLQVEVIDHGAQLEVTGEVIFGDEKAPLTKALAGPFVDLGNAVGLLDSQVIEEELGALKKMAVVGDSVCVPKKEVGALVSPNRSVEQVARLLGRFENCEPGPGFTGSLHAYQLQGLQWLMLWYGNGLGGILADEMGLGKTVQVLALFSRIQSCRPTLIVVPTSLVGQWKGEFDHFLPNASLYVHAGPERSLEQAPFVLTTYGILLRDREELSAIDWELVVLDEANAIKNARSQSFNAACSLRAKSRIALTGTPVLNSLDELQALLTFCLGAPVSNHAPYMLRRTKDDADIDLPEKITQDVFINLSDDEQAHYNDFEKALREGLVEKISADGAKAHAMEILEGILRLRQICCHPGLIGQIRTEWSKFEQFMGDVEELVADGRKILIYSQFTSVLDMMEKRLSAPYLRLDGSVKNRADLVERYQTDPEIPIFLISLKAGGVGLNLTAADYVLLYDPWWNNAIENQAIDRAHRLGRQGRVIARRYYVRSTIEEKIKTLKSTKDQLAASIEPSIDDLYSLLH